MSDLKEELREAVRIGQQIQAMSPQDQLVFASQMLRRANALPAEDDDLRLTVLQIAKGIVAHVDRELILVVAELRRRGARG